MNFKITAMLSGVALSAVLCGEEYIMCQHVSSRDSNECVFCKDILSQEHDHWPTFNHAENDPVFQSARGIMGTENFGQDDSLRRAINFVLRDELKCLRELLADCAKTFRNYEQIHLSKTPPDTKKAEENANKAYAIECALTHNAKR